jgi:hypothetical protein
MKNLLLRCSIFMGLSLAASAALGNAFAGPNPDIQNLTWDGFSNGSVVTQVSTNSGGSFSGVNAGQFFGRFDGEGNGLSVDDFFRFFCIDLTEFVDGNPNPYKRTQGLDGAHTATDAAELSRLFAAYYPNALTGTYYSGGQTNFGNFANANDSAAFQIAVWEIWFDTDNNLNLSGGSFRATGSAVAQAQTELNAIGNGNAVAPGWTFFEFTNQGKQDYLSVEHSGPLQQAPEPGTLILLGAGALAAWGTSKRNRKTA